MASSSRVLPFSSARPSAPAHGVTAPGCGGESFSLNGSSPAIARLWSQVRRVAPHFRTALLSGEPGTGGEFAARALHDHSPFRDKPLRILSAAAAEAYFAAGGPHTRNPTNGAVYLEEVEQLSRTAQNGLLRLRGTRAGCVIAFGRQDLRALVGSGSFSGELAAALGSLRIVLPALRDRQDDIPTLLHCMASRMAGQMGRAEPLLDAEFVEAAREFAWPRNLDQMGEMVSWLLSHCSASVLYRADFEAACEACEPEQDGGVQPVRMVRLEQMVQEHVRAVLLACNGNKLRAAEVLGISRSTLYRMLDAAAPAVFLARAG